ncbi:MAG: hypothetical protein ACLR78_10420 [Roseburia sp.]
MVGNGVVPFPCGSGRGKTFSQTRNIVIFGSERGKTLFQTREVDEKKEKEEKKEATRVWKRKTFSQTRNIVIFGSERGKRRSRPAPGETKRNDSGREKHGFRPRNPENSRKSDAQSCRRLRDMLWSRTW